MHESRNVRRKYCMGYKYETHMHTSEASACAVSTAAEQVRAYYDKGYTGIIVTDHFINGNSSCPKHYRWADKMTYFASGYKEAKAVGDALGLDIFFGWEYSIKGSDFLTYGLGLDFLLEHNNVDRLPIEEYSALVRKCGGYIAQAHPYRNAWYIENKHPVSPDLLDGLEVFNASMPDEINIKALNFALLHNLPMQAGSDSHTVNLSFTSGIVLEKKAAGIADIITAIKSHSAEMIAL